MEMALELQHAVKLVSIGKFLLKCHCIKLRMTIAVTNHDTHYKSLSATAVAFFVHDGLHLNPSLMTHKNKQAPSMHST